MKEDFFVDETEIVKVLEKIEQCDNSSFARYISDEGLNLCDEAVIISGICGIIMAYNDFGPYALVWQIIIMNAITTIGIWIMKPWKPMLVFSLSSFGTEFE